MRACLAAYAIIFLVIPLGGTWLGFDPWAALLFALVLAFAATFAIGALLLFRPKDDEGAS